MLSPAETAELYPLMRTEDIYGSVYSPQDGTIDPAGYCTALTRASKKMGAKVAIETKSIALVRFFNAR